MCRCVLCLIRVGHASRPRARPLPLHEMGTPETFTYAMHSRLLCWIAVAGLGALAVRGLCAGGAPVRQARAGAGAPHRAGAGGAGAARRGLLSAHGEGRCRRTAATSWGGGNWINRGDSAEMIGLHHLPTAHD